MMETVEAELCFPHLHNSSCRKPQTNPTEVLVTDILLLISCMLTTTLNLLVIISIAHFRQLHSSTNFLLLSLAVSDFFVGLVVMPVEGIRWRICWTLGDIFCALYPVLPVTFIMASVGNIVLISVDRYLAICDPLHYATRMTDKVVNISISVCWLYAFIYSILFWLENYRNLGQYKSCYGECVVYFFKELDFIMTFVIPVTIIIVLYMQVFVVAVSQARAMRSHVTAVRFQHSDTSKTSRKSEIKAAKNLGVIVFVYLLCYCPYYLFAFSGGSILILGKPIELILYSMVFLNSCVNPFIYALLYPWFREAIKLIVTLQIVRQGSCDLMIL